MALSIGVNEPKGPLLTTLILFLMDKWQPPKHIEVDESSLNSVEVSLPFDPHKLEVQKSVYTPQTYKRLSSKQRKCFERELERDEKGDFDTVWDYLVNWKDPENYHEVFAQSYERLAKEALDIPTEVRNGGTLAAYPNESQKHTFEELYVATQCFLEIHFGTRDIEASKRVYRGIREPSIAKLVAQVIDNPGSDRYHFYTSTISNHTGLEGVGFHHSDGIVINLSVHRERIALATDRLFNTPAQEDEFQLVGGIISVGPDGIIYEGAQSGQTQSLVTLIRKMDSPETLEADDHRDIADLVEMMDEHDEPATTTEGAVRLKEWFLEVKSRELFSAMKTQSLKATVVYLIEAGEAQKIER